MELSDTDTFATEVFKALGDPVRWNIVMQIAAVEELPCAALEGMLPVSKPTISYHTKILQHAGLLQVRKEGRNYYYCLRRDTLQSVIERMRQTLPGLQPVDNRGRIRHSQKRTERRSDVRARRAAGDEDVVVLTW